MDKEYTMIRIPKADWRRIKKLAQKEKRTQIGIISLALVYYEKKLKD